MDCTCNSIFYSSDSSQCLLCHVQPSFQFFYIATKRKLYSCFMWVELSLGTWNPGHLSSVPTPVPWRIPMTSEGITPTSRGLAYSLVAGLSPTTSKGTGKNVHSIFGAIGFSYFFFQHPAFLWCVCCSSFETLRVHTNANLLT